MCYVMQRRIGVTEDSDSSSEDVVDGEEVTFEAQDSDSDEDGEGGQGRSVKYVPYDHQYRGNTSIGLQPMHSKGYTSCLFVFLSVCLLHVFCHHAMPKIYQVYMASHSKLARESPGHHLQV